MIRTWTEIGRAHTNDKQELFDAAIADIAWSIPPCTLPFMQGEGIKGIVKQIGGRGVQRVGYAVTQEDMALLAVEKQYVNGLARIYALDLGSEVVFVATDFEGKEG